MKTVEQTRHRPPFFDGADTDKARYSFACRTCGTGIAVHFQQILDAAWGWRKNTEASLASRLAEHFGIDLQNRSIGTGMDAVVSSRCPKCGWQCYVFFWFHEYRNSCYEISLPGVAEDGA